MSKQGAHLHSLASRLFHADTMEYVLGPALADLQLECRTKQPSRWRQSWVCLRAYVFFWSAVVAHSWRSLVDGSADATADDHRAIRRVLFRAATIGVMVTAAMMVPGWLNRPASAAGPRTAFDRDIVRALPLLIPQATPISIPAGMLFGTLWAVRKPATRSVRRMVFVLGIVCSLISAGMFGWVIPQANQAYRVVVYQKVLGYGQAPDKGVNELSWHDLRARINAANTQEFSAQTAYLRLAYHTRIALVATPLVFAMLALALVGRPRRSISLLLGLLVFVGYYTVLVFARLVAQGMLSPVIVAWAPNVVALIVIVMISASSRFSAVQS